MFILEIRDLSIVFRISKYCTLCEKRFTICRILLCDENRRILVALFFGVEVINTPYNVNDVLLNGILQKLRCI